MRIASLLDMAALIGHHDDDKSSPETRREPFPQPGTCEQPSIKLAVRNVLIEINPLDGRSADVPSYPAVFQLKDLKVACLPILLCSPKSPKHPHQRAQHLEQSGIMSTNPRVHTRRRASSVSQALSYVTSSHDGTKG
jgi:hypothetical protein